MSTIENRLTELVKSHEKLAEKLSFFDSNIWLGQPGGFPLAGKLPVEELPRALEKSFLTGGLVSHWRGKRVSPQDGNRALEAVSERLSDNLYFIWSGLPLYPTEPGPLPGKGKVADKVRGVRLFPTSHNFPFADWMIGSLCDWLVERALPLFVWHTEINWSSLRSLALKFPELTIVVESQTQKILYHSRPLFAIMRECPNIIVETSNFIGPGFIEYAVREFGANRLIFGSFQPVSDPLVPIGMILDADIPESDKALIAGGNLRQLINGVRQ